MITLSLRKRYLSLVAAGGLSLVSFAAIPVQHVAAGPTQPCEDDNFGDDFVILRTPITLAVEIQSGPTFGTGPGAHVAVCYSTTPLGTASELAGGALAVDAAFSTWSNPNGNLVNVGCFPDAGAPVAPSCDLGTNPTVGLAGSNLTFSFPFSLCLGVGGCPLLANAPSATGVFVGSVAICGPACFAVSGVCALVDGIGLCQGPAGASLGNPNPLNQVCGGPVLAGGLCVPLFPPSCIAVGGNTIATLTIPGLPPQPITLPKQQVYNAGVTC